MSDNTGKYAGPSARPWWDRVRHADRRPALLTRARILARLRAWFAAEEFVEVECTALQHSPCAEAHLHAFATTRVHADGRRENFYLHTSPEFAAKKLLAAGETRIFDFARVWRNRESGKLHASEFTMLEWYRAHAPYAVVMGDTVAIIRMAAEEAGTCTLASGGVAIDPFLAPEKLRAADAFRVHAGIDLAACIDGGRDVFAAAARDAGVVIAGDDGWSDIFTRVMAEKIEPHLGRERLTLFHEYPISEAALARPCPHDPRFAERFEAYACGVELANGFGELTDAAEQRRRFVAEMERKQLLYGETYPVDEDFIAALEHMPPASGVALGFDRLVMLATHARSVHDVQWTPSP